MNITKETQSFLCEFPSLTLSAILRNMHDIPTEMFGGATTFCIGSQRYLWSKVYTEVQAIYKKFGDRKVAEL
jgi:hypothetical protein